MKNRTLSFLVMLIFLIGIPSGCAPNLKERIVQIPPDISETSLTIVENILLALERNEYNTFSRDFSQEMQKAMTKDSFENLQQAFQKNLGNLNSVSFIKAESSQTYIATIFKAMYAKNSITVRLVLSPSSPYIVTGLWFPDFPVK